MRTTTMASLIVLAALAIQPAKAKPLPLLALTSPDLPAGKPIPWLFIGKDFGCSGGEVSPSLSWRDGPAGTKSYMVTMYDPSAPPQSGWWHWMVTDIPTASHGLARGAGNPGGALPAGARMVRPDGDAPVRRYYGPCPDKGDPAHRYTITVYALDVTSLGLPDTAPAPDYDFVAMSHALARGKIVRRYRRP